ncbi:hypothetical protein [uncultured Thomasclavelia sp.]|uniref:hypothetical protein n=1 Tax=uncultured Thomasclavelia sp. TaxID=3025759 RepID=UPI00259431F0|nr:hypothetical protein [uncultured Thomasclavelia sp.]
MAIYLGSEQVAGNLVTNNAINNYTSEEKVIGTFMGKPLYQKTVSIIFTEKYSAGDYNDGDFVAQNINYSTITKIFSPQGVAGTIGVYNGYNQTSKNFVYIDSSTGILKGVTSRDDMLNKPFYCVCEYTKTID